MSKILVAYFSASGTTAGTAKALAPLCPGAAVFDGKVFNGGLSRDALRKWVETL